MRLHALVLDDKGIILHLHFPSVQLKNTRKHTFSVFFQVINRIAHNEVSSDYILSILIKRILHWPHSYFNTIPFIVYTVLYRVHGGEMALFLTPIHPSPPPLLKMLNKALDRDTLLYYCDTQSVIWFPFSGPG